uniref:uncharacterized protein LOC113475383 isoform X2 n=1 Tax=Ciona intestinalis TaxID=7719 RepID=UPI000EF49F7A|nr:uncharacterized protein LOC113475383 isoform X2 [Ciona intestinalis]|eukprot:XP_026695284.1 uncharacterized protein LOC113475383 isoform X2 [Ciona intestinalis]
MTDCELYWGNYKQNCILMDEHLQEKKSQAEHIVSTRMEQRIAKGAAFSAQRCITDDNHQSTGQRIGDQLKQWIVYNSWSYCQLCMSVAPVSIRPTFRTLTPPLTKQCICTKQRYHIPALQHWPKFLQNLTEEDQQVLSIYTLHIGSTSRKQHGYRFKDGGVAATLSKKFVHQKIDIIEDGSRKHKLRNAYHWLCQATNSKYNDFIQKHRQGDLPQRVPFYQMFKIPCMETAIWPVMYPFNYLCESEACGGQTHLSTKKGFSLKVLSNITDYSTSFAMLRFQYDRWLYKTISGAIESGKKMQCSPAQSLEGKSFSPTFWKWQHYYLIDAVNQFGPPDIFITISPYEWTFPQPFWLKQRMAETGCRATTIASAETLCIAHTLQEVLRGYISGKSKSKWTKHLLSNHCNSRLKNLKTYFYRFEFQQRGTLHVHYIAWLDKTSAIDTDRLFGHIPTSSKVCAETVYLTQTSKTGPKGVQVNEGPTYIDPVNHKIILHRPATDHALNLRQYFDTLAYSLQCSMDVQLTDQHGMLMRYVSSYVSKMKDNTMAIRDLYSDVSGCDVAYRYLCELAPCEPEMIMALSNVRMAHTSSKTKRFVVPYFDKVYTNKTVTKYLERPHSDATMSLFKYMHTYSWVGDQQVKRYNENIVVLVGFKSAAITSDQFFFQDALLHRPFTNVKQLLHVQFENVPDDLKMFSFAVHNRWNFWKCNKKIREFSRGRGDLSFYTESFLSYVDSLRHTWKCWLQNSISPVHLNVPKPITNSSIIFNVQQQNFFTTVLNTVDKRSKNVSFTALKFFLLTGEHGTGKSEVLRRIIEVCCTNKHRVLLATPTGLTESDSNQPTEDDVISVYKRNPNTKFLTFTNKGSAFINDTICCHLFCTTPPLGFFIMENNKSEPRPLYEGMFMRITENRDKSRRYVNGQCGIVRKVFQKIVYLEIENSCFVRIYPISNEKGGRMYYPFTPAYASTIHKSQGQTLQKVCVWFDAPSLPEGCAYVALSRVKQRNSLVFLVPPTPAHFKPKNYIFH